MIQDALCCGIDAGLHQRHAVKMDTVAWRRTSLREGNSVGMIAKGGINRAHSLGEKESHPVLRSSDEGEASTEALVKKKKAL
jgi:hypothetical protein